MPPRQEKNHLAANFKTDLPTIKTKPLLRDRKIHDMCTFVKPGSDYLFLNLSTTHKVEMMIRNAGGKEKSLDHFGI